MEKRWSDRKELHVDVDIYDDGALLGSCHSHDIGLGGAYLDLNGSFVVQKDMDVDLVFSLQDTDHSTRHKITARVTRVSDEGAGLKFCEFNTGVFRSLQEIMSYKRSTNDHSGNSGTH